MLQESDLITILNSSRHEVLPLRELRITQHVTNSVIRTEVVQVWDYCESIDVLFKPSLSRKKLKVILGTQILRARIEAPSLFIDTPHYTTFKDRKLLKYQDYKIIELSRIPANSTKEIKVQFSQLGCVLPVHSSMFFNHIRRFDDEIIGQLRKYSAHIYLNMSSKIDFLKVNSRNQTQVLYLQNKTSASITQTNLTSMADLSLYFRHEHIHKPQLTFGRQIINRQTVIMIDYLPDFNEQKDFKATLKLETQQEQDSFKQFNASSTKIKTLIDSLGMETIQNSLLPVEYSIVIDASCPAAQNRVQNNQISRILEKVLSNLSAAIDCSNSVTQKPNSKNQSKTKSTTNNNNNNIVIDITQSESSSQTLPLDVSQQQKQTEINLVEESQEKQQSKTSYISFSVNDHNGWDFKQSKRQIYPHNSESHQIIQSQLLPLVQFKQSETDLCDFLNHFSMLKSTKNLPRVLLFFTFGYWRDFEKAICDLTALRHSLDLTLTTQPIKQLELQRESLLDMVVVYCGNDDFVLRQLNAAMTPSKVFTSESLAQGGVPVDAMVYFKFHSNFSVQTTPKSAVEFATLPCNGVIKKIQRDPSDSSIQLTPSGNSTSFSKSSLCVPVPIKFNQIFQEFLFLEHAENAADVVIRYFDGRIGKYNTQTINFHNKEPKPLASHTVKSKKSVSLANEKKEYFLSSKDIALYGLIQVISKSILEKSFEIDLSVSNRLLSPLTQFVFRMSDEEDAASSDSSIKEITRFVQTSSSGAQTQKGFSSNQSASRIPSTFKLALSKPAANTQFENEANQAMVHGQLHKQLQEIVEQNSKKDKGEISKQLTLLAKSSSASNQQQQQSNNNPSNDLISEMLRKKKQEKDIEVSQKKLRQLKGSTPMENLSIGKVHNLVQLQAANGAWRKSEVLLKIIGVSNEEFTLCKRRITSRADFIEELIMTSLVLITLKCRFLDFIQFWNSSQISATSWIDAHFHHAVFYKVFRITREIFDSKNRATES